MKHRALSARKGSRQGSPPRFTGKNVLRSGLLACLVTGLFSLAGPAHAQYTQVWEDTFPGASGSAPNAANWAYQTGNNWGNGELDYGTTSTSNAYLSGNNSLILAAQYNGTEYTDGHLTTQGIRYYGPYGEVQADVEIFGSATPADSQGIGEAFWAMGEDYVTTGVPWPYCGEIDMLETHGGTTLSQATSNGTIHGYDVNNDDNYGYEGLTAPFTESGDTGLYQAFHTYGMYWEPFQIQFFVDGTVYSSPDVTQLDCNGTWPFNQAFFLINSQGVGGQVSGAPTGSTTFPAPSTTSYVQYSDYTAGTPQAPGAVTATAYSNGVQLSWGASGTSGVYYDVYENTTNTYIAGDLGTLVSAEVTGTSLYISSLAPNTTYYFNVTAANFGGESSPSEVTVTTSPLGNSSGVYVHCGGYGVGKYMKDLSFNTNGNPNYHWPYVTSTTATANPAPAQVYQTERWGPQSYTVNNLNPNSYYDVRMDMVEADTAITGAGQRQFNAYINGWQAMTNFDIYATAGGQFIACDKDYYAMSDEQGTINLDLTLGAANDPTISGLEIIPYAGTNNTPGAPSALSATTVSTTQINLAWTASGTSGVTYNVYRANTPYFVSGIATKIASAVNGTTYNDTAVPFPGTTYYYRVAAINGGGESTRSNVASAATSQSQSGLVIAIDSGSTAQVGNFVIDTDWGGTTYTAVATATINTANVTNPAPMAVYQTERYYTPTYWISGLTPGATYTVRLHNSENYWTAAGQREFNVFINGTEVLTNYDIVASSGGEFIANIQQFSATPNVLGQIVIAFTLGAEDSATIKGIEIDHVSNPAIAAPSVNAVSGNASVTLSWPAVSGATSYNINRSTSSGTEANIATGVTTTSYTAAGLTNGVTYYFTVNSVGGAGTSAPSVEVYCTPLGSVSGSAPATPTGVTASASSGQVVVSWTASSGATSYNVFESTTSGGEGTTPYATGITATSYTNTGLTNGTTYYYTVDALNSYGSSAQSTQVSATPASGIPAAPTGLTATAGNAQIALSWTASSGATSYNVYRETATGAESTTAIATGVTTTSYTNTGLTNGTAYYYKVAALNASGSSALSTEASATPSAGSGTLVLGIACGGTAAYSPYVADTDYSGGGDDSWTTTVNTTLLTSPVPPAALLLEDREGNFTYTIPNLTANASYTVTMYFV
ncbi:MAG: fibronectin type III domain-containing protein, partial [Capsulimonadaceae bacterium]